MTFLLFSPSGPLLACVKLVELRELCDSLCDGRRWCKQAQPAKWPQWEICKQHACSVRKPAERLHL